MSWDYIDRKQSSVCACGKGQVTRIEYSGMNDWNQTREGYRDETIECKDCKKKYHIEHITGSYYAHKGDEGTFQKDYLVPNGETINPPEVSMPYLGFEEKIIASYNKTELSEVIADMQKNKFSTRLELDNSKKIVSEYKYFRKKCSIPPIIDFIKDLIDNYDSHKWTKEKYKKQQALVEKSQKKNNDIRKDVLSRSYLLNFEYVK